MCVRVCVLWWMENFSRATPEECVQCAVNSRRPVVLAFEGNHVNMHKWFGARMVHVCDGICVFLGSHVVRMTVAAQGRKPTFKLVDVVCASK